MRQLALALALSGYPITAFSQSPADSATLTVAVHGVDRSTPGKQLQRVESGTASTAGAAPTVPLAGAVVALKGGAPLGTTNDSGRVTVRFPYSERVDLVVRLKEYKDLNCRIRLKEPVDSIRAELLATMAVAVWNTFGCKPLR